MELMPYLMVIIIISVKNMLHFKVDRTKLFLGLKWKLIDSVTIYFFILRVRVRSCVCEMVGDVCFQFFFGRWKVRGVCVTLQISSARALILHAIHKLIDV